MRIFLERVHCYQIEKKFTEEKEKLVFYDSQSSQTWQIEIEKLKNYNVMISSNNIIVKKKVQKELQYNVNSGATCYDLMSFFLNYGGYNAEFDILNQTGSRNDNNNNRFGVVNCKK